ncbi:UDP-glucose/GDP-mannose dehydrogenase family protein [Spirochaetia bacterium 38H-sp]|uniref:UDP-glucose 6-dehydrogenase n=1 Tax=Rarispira pelagica TaxID=3141764 RepID=A0ABU9U975_9SPIR
MAIKIAVIGTGYVGISTCVGLSDFGNIVVGFDIDDNKIKRLSSGDPVIYENGMEYYLKKNLETGRLSFTSDFKVALKDAEVVFLAVGTPEREDGSADLSQIKSALDAIAEIIDRPLVIVTKSTVPAGTNRWINDYMSSKVDENLFEVVSNPEFLREGKAIHDFFHPDRVVIGTKDGKENPIMRDIYRSLYLIETPFIWCNWETAELIKYASNAFLATKITFINQMANLAEEMGADIHKIAKAMGMDGRISSKFLHPGPGYGGSCFPKDTKALAKTGRKVGVVMSLIEEVISSNETQKERMIEKAKRLLENNISDKKVAVLGLAFKAETDDIRESPAITIVKGFLKEGVKISAHDPKAVENFKKLFPYVEYYDNAYDACKNANLVIICTEWNDYRNLDLDEISRNVKEKKILDLRNVLDPESAIKKGFVYEGVGRKGVNL